MSLALYYERLPQCLGELPFVDPADIPQFPRWNASPRPLGRNFLDVFPMDDEKLVWDHFAGDFEMLGYERFNCGLPEGSNNCLHLTPDRAATR